MTAPLLSLNNLGREIEGRWLFRNVRIDIYPRDTIAFQGATGSGKSQLLRVIVGLETPSEGEILWNNKAISLSEIPRFRANCLYVSQTPGIFAGTVWDNLRKPYQWKQYEAKSFLRPTMEDRFKQLGKPPEFFNQKAVNLSGGEKQMVALSRAIFLNPDFLLLDEPTSAMDPQTALLFEQWLLEWASTTGSGFLWISHSPEQAARIAKRQWRLEGGKLLES